MACPIRYEIHNGIIEAAITHLHTDSATHTGMSARIDTFVALVVAAAGGVIIQLAPLLLFIDDARADILIPSFVVKEA